MCGIVGYIGKENCIKKIIEGLTSLEYRGYDSAGIAYKKDNKIIIKKEVGKIENLKKILTNDESFIGIGHTRWATHGKVNKVNCHPHKVGDITLVHNGIIENYKDLKDELKEYSFKGETDSEILAAFIDKLYKKYNNMIEVLNILGKYLKGSYALGIIRSDEDRIYAIRKDSPLIIGVAKSGNFIASDVPAILKYTNKYYLLLDSEYAVIDKDSVIIYNNGKIVDKKMQTFNYSIDVALKNGYDHFMLKEIYESEDVVQKTINKYAKNIDILNKTFKGLEKYDAIDIVGCGSAYHVGLIGKYLITKYGRKQVNVDIASEYRYNEHVYSKKHLIVFISQSGETADTLAVLRQAKKDGIKTLSIVNVVGSSIARESDKVIYIESGPEIAVATTKAYSCQLSILSLMACYLGLKNNILDESILNDYLNINTKIKLSLNNVDVIKKIAKKIYKKEDVFFLGRKIDYYLALEASLKLKEISYIHSEAYAAGELKHGTISLIESGTPVISIITDDDIKLKTLSNVKEVASRGAFNIIITNRSIDSKLYDEIITLPDSSELLSGILAIIKCQLLSYYVAKYKGCDIDKPRNLAKSVTVE